jgi:hypothetical protein
MRHLDYALPYPVLNIFVKHFFEKIRSNNP